MKKIQMTMNKQFLCDVYRHTQMCDYVIFNKLNMGVKVSKPIALTMWNVTSHLKDTYPTFFLGGVSIKTSKIKEYNLISALKELTK